MTDMGLHIAHIPRAKTLAVDFTAVSGMSGQVLAIETCQRRIWLSNRPVDEWFPAELRPLTDVFSGHKAYGFLLQVATGLYSAIPGETEIFGQIKQSWSRFLAESRNEILVRFLTPTMQSLFRDTKAVRTQYLQNIGGSSYGSMARKLIDPAKDDSLLILGAGQLALAVVPFFARFKLRLWNRDKLRLDSLIDVMRAKYPESSIEKVDDDGLAEAAAMSHHVVVCIPVSAEREEMLARARDGKDLGTVLHLGGYEDETKHWRLSRRFRHLGDVMRHQKDQNEKRLAMLEGARRACEELSRKPILSSRAKTEYRNHPVAAQA